VSTTIPRWTKRGTFVLGVLLTLDLAAGGVIDSNSVPAIVDDPDARAFFYAQPRAVESAFVLDEKQGVFRTNALLQQDEPPLVQPQEFAAQRGQETVRIAFLGGSTVQGLPYPPEKTFPSLAAAAIEAEVPGRKVDVLNLGTGTANSHQLGRIAGQLSSLKPDVVVIEAGHNDAGQVGFHKALLQASINRRRPLRRIAEWSATYRLLRGVRERRWGPTSDRALFGPVRDSSELGVEIPQGVPSLSKSVFLIGEPWTNDYQAAAYAAYVMEHRRLLARTFERAIRTLVHNARRDGAVVVLIKPGANLRNIAPALSFHSAPEDVSRRVGKHFAALISLSRAKLRRARVAFVAAPLPVGDARAMAVCAEVSPLLDEAEGISSSWADLHYMRGLCLLHTEPDSAAPSFRLARDLSPTHAPAHRAPSSLLDALDRIAAGARVPLVDLPESLAKASPSGVPGSDLFADAIHLNEAGHAVAAKALAAVLSTLPAVRSISPTRAPDLSPKKYLAARKAKKTRPPPVVLRDAPLGIPEMAPTSPDAIGDPEEDRSGNLGEDEHGGEEASLPPVVLRDGPLGIPEMAPISPDAIGDPEEDRSGNLGEDDVGTPSPLEQDPQEQEDDGEMPPTDRTGNLGEGDYGDPSRTNQGEGDEGPTPGD
jgi:lysophospholipase L1-like esterase